MRRSNNDAIEVLLAAGANSNTPRVLEQCHPTSLQLLIRHGADIDQDGAGGPLFHSIIEHTKQDKALTLIELGADVNLADENGTTPVMHAAALGRNKAFNAMIAKGADLYAIDNSGRSVARHVAESLTGGAHLSTETDRANATRLARQLIKMLPAQPEDQVLLTLVIDDVKGLRRMLHDGLDPNTMIVGGIGLIGMSMGDIRNRWSNIGGLFEAFRINAAFPTTEERDNEMGGMTLLMWATAMQRLDCITTLLESGADPKQTNQGGVNAFSIAQARSGYESVLGLLKGHDEVQDRNSTEISLRCHDLGLAASDIQTHLDGLTDGFAEIDEKFHGPLRRLVIERRWQEVCLNYLLGQDDCCLDLCKKILEDAEEFLFGHHFQESDSRAAKQANEIEWIEPFAITIAAGAALGQWDRVAEFMIFPVENSYRGEKSPSWGLEWYEWPLWLHMAAVARGDTPMGSWLEGMKQDSTRKSKAMLTVYYAIEEQKAKQVQRGIDRIVQAQLAWQKKWQRGIRPAASVSPEATFFYELARRESLEIEYQDTWRPHILNFEKS